MNTMKSGRFLTRFLIGSSTLVRREAESDMDTTASTAWHSNRQARTSVQLKVRKFERTNASTSSGVKLTTVAPGYRSEGRKELLRRSGATARSREHLSLRRASVGRGFEGA